mgnify:CR=1 FL=1
MRKKNKIKIIVNGKQMTVNLKYSLKNLIDKLKLPIKKVAIELNREIVNKKRISINWNKWTQKCLKWKKIFKSKKDVVNISQKTNLYELSEVFSKILPPDAVFLCDSGFIDVILPTNIRFRKKLQRFVCTCNFTNTIF